MALPPENDSVNEAAYQPGEAGVQPQDYPSGAYTPAAESIILDPGSGYMKCGFAGDEAPRSIFKNMIGKPRADSVGILSGGDGDGARVFVGEDAYQNSAILDIEYCITDGQIKSWEAFKACVEHAIETELRCDPTQYNVLLTEAPSNAWENRVSMFKILFDDFRVRAAQCQVQAVLSLYASGRTTGMVVDSGDGVTHTVPVYKGYGVRSAVCAVKNAGRNISRRVLECLNKYHNRDYLTQPNGLEIARDVKEKICRVAMDFDKEMADIKKDRTLAMEYQFSDGSTEMLAETILEPAEVLYRPKNYGMQLKSLPEMLGTTIEKCDIEMRTDMYKNTVLSGGTTCLNGFEKRLESEYKKIVADRARESIKVSAPSDRKFAVFNGGSILCSLSSFTEEWITLDEFNEKGEIVFDQKKLF